MSEPYKFTKNDERYLFHSTGPNGTFLKSVKFSRYHNTNLYELLLEDYLEKFDMYTLNTTTDNGDLDKIYRTMFEIMAAYSIEYPERTIFSRGTTKTIQRLDRIFINKYLDEISKTFSVYTVDFDHPEKSLPFDSKIDCDGYTFLNKTIDKKRNEYRTTNSAS